MLLVDDEELFKQGLRALLEKENFVGQIFEATDAFEAIKLVKSQHIDIMLLDVRLRGPKGPELLAKLNEIGARPKVIAVTGLEGVELIINLLKLGINGVVFKLDGYSEIVKTLHGVISNGSFFQEKILRIIQLNSHRWDAVPTVSLTFQENELLRAIASGLTTKAIAGHLRMTEATTETYRIRLIKKLGVPNTAALLAYAYANGIL